MFHQRSVTPALPKVSFSRSASVAHAFAFDQIKTALRFKKTNLSGHQRENVLPGQQQAGRG